MESLNKHRDAHFNAPKMAALALLLGLGIHGAAALFAHAAAAEIISPDTTGWMPLDRYDDKARRFPQRFAKPAAPPPAAEAAPAAPTPAKPSEPAMAQPSRPLNLAPLPGMNHEFDVRVTSTEDDKNDGPPARIDNTENGPTLRIPNTNWIDAATAAKKAAQQEVGEGESRPLEVRLATLPDRQITPIPLGSVTKPRAQRVAAKPLPITTPKTPAAAAACDALTAHKKRQLAAIESDRKTLAALQAAIAELGLGSKLDFMTDANSTLNTSADGTAPLINYPTIPAATATAKN